MITIAISFSLLLLFQDAIVPPDRLPELAAFLLGAFSSVVVQFVKGKFQDTKARFAIAVLLSALVGTVSYLIAKPAETNLIVFVIHVFAYSQLAYNGFWKIIWEEVLKFGKIGERKA